MTHIVMIIDYGSGNLRSAAKAFDHVIAENALDFKVVVSNNPKDLDTASHIVLPGQGAFGDCMAGLKAIPDMINALERSVLVEKKPFLGICVGMQLLVERGHEYGEHAGLGWLAGEVIPLELKDESLKLPHMGWNVGCFPHGVEHPVLRNQQKFMADGGPHYYFVHSFMVQCKDTQNLLGTVEYGAPITAIIGRDNILGVQFHPEKSQEAGLQILHDFLLWKL